MSFFIKQATELFASTNRLATTALVTERLARIKTAKPQNLDEFCQQVIEQVICDTWLGTLHANLYVFEYDIVDSNKYLTVTDIIKHKLIRLGLVVTSDDIYYERPNASKLVVCIRPRFDTNYRSVSLNYNNTSLSNRVGRIDKRLRSYCLSSHAKHSIQTLAGFSRQIYWEMRIPDTSSKPVAKL